MCCISFNCMFNLEQNIPPVVDKNVSLLIMKMDCKLICHLLVLKTPLLYKQNFKSVSA